MSEQTPNETQEDIELKELRSEAEARGITVHHAAKAQKIRDLIAEYDLNKSMTPDSAPATEPVAPSRAKRSAKEIKAEAMKLVRCKISTMNPLKKEWEAEPFTFGNSVIGSHTRVIKYDHEWHVPKMLFDIIKGKKYQAFRTKRNPTTGIKYREGYLAKEYAVEVLPPLTDSELKELARKQAVANGETK